MDDNTPHPADSFIDDIKQHIGGMFDGSTVVKGIRDAWDKHFGSKPATPAQPAAVPLPSAWDQANQQATQQALSPASAAKIRSRVKGK